MEPNELFNRICNVLEEKEINFHRVDRHLIIIANMPSVVPNLSSFKCAVHVRDTSMVSYATCPVSASGNEEKVVEFLNRANYGLVNGCFEMDYDDGEIRYRANNNFECAGEAENIDDDAILSLFHLPLMMFLRYGKGLVNVLFCDADPAKEIEICESKDISIDDDDEDDKGDKGNNDDDTNVEIDEEKAMEILRSILNSTDDEEDD
ncbi:hypothetical protein IJT10_08700 [bacterium]|nr:hypothetical protein [bacterium]